MFYLWESRGNPVDKLGINDMTNIRNNDYLAYFMALLALPITLLNLPLVYSS